MSGEAEGVLGKFLPKHRDELIVTSKAGIVPMPGGGLRRWARRGTKLANLAFGTPVMAWGEYRFGAFDTPSLKKSVETSLRALRTDRLDALLLHEVDAPDLADGTVMALLEDLRAAGRINFYGIASTRVQTRRLVAGPAGRMSIIQTASTVLEDGLAPLGDRSRFLAITHSVLAEALKKIVAHLAANDAFRAQWVASVGVDPAARESIAELLLAEALDANRGGIVLFSTTSPARIASAARVARERPYTQEQISGLRGLAAKIAAA
jgi:D-threo-aldose 1-dehydrogenase